MLEKIQIRNFQTHESLKIKFDPQITAITGPTDAGKSTILRAIRWVVENRPLGDGFVRIGSNGATFVSLWANGTRIKREKDGIRANTYEVGPDKLEAFGTTVPEEVQKATKLGQVNFQDQIDPPFWFTLSPGEVAKQINSIVDLECIDKAVADIKSRVKKSKAETEVSKDRLDKVTQEAEELAFIERADKKYKVVEGLEEELEEIQYEAEKIKECVEEWEKWDKRVTEREKLISEFDKLEALHGELVSLTDQIIDLEGLIEEASQEVVVPDFSQVEDRFEELRKIQEELGSLEKWTVEVETAESRIEELEMKHKRLEKELAERFDVCPLCERKL